MVTLLLAQGGEFAFVVFQAGAGHGVAQVQVVIQIALILAADVQASAQLSELRDADLRIKGGQGTELAGGRGPGAEAGMLLVGFVGLEVVQRRLQQ